MVMELRFLVEARDQRNWGVTEPMRSMGGVSRSKDFEWLLDLESVCLEYHKDQKYLGL